MRNSYNLRYTKKTPEYFYSGVLRGATRTTTIEQERKIKH